MKPIIPYIKLNEVSAELAQTVKKVNGIGPDETGNVNVAGGSGGLVAKYTYNGNQVVNVTALDIATNTFTAVGHGITNDMAIAFALNDGESALEKNKLPNPIPSGWIYAINCTSDTFQLATSKGGTAIDFIDNPNIDYTKWHIETISSVVTSIFIEGLPPKKSYKAIGICKSNSNGSNIFRILPKTPNYNVSKFISNLRSVSYTNPSPPISDHGHGILFMRLEVLFNITEKAVFINCNDLIVKSASDPSSNVIVRSGEEGYISSDSTLINKDITNIELNLGGYMLLNGSTLEVYTA